MFHAVVSRFGESGPAGQGHRPLRHGVCTADLGRSSGR